MYLCIYKDFLGKLHFDAFTCPRSSGSTYVIAPDGVELMHQWKRTVDDSLLSGVLADWLEDNRAELIRTVTAHSYDLCTGDLLDDLVAHLRNRFLRSTF